MLKMYLKYQSIGKYVKPTINPNVKFMLKGLFIIFGLVCRKK